MIDWPPRPLHALPANERAPVAILGSLTVAIPLPLAASVSADPITEVLAS